MRVDINFQDGYSIHEMPFRGSDFKRFLRLINQELKDTPEWGLCLKILGAKPQVLSILICGDESIRFYNKNYRHLDRATDVLSFPSMEWEENLKSLSPKDVPLGDLIFSLPAIQRGARRGRRTFKHELLNVFIHGYLHLLGFDHVRGAKKAKRMFQIQKGLYLKLKKDI